MKKIRNIAALLLAGVLMAILMTGCNTPELKPSAPSVTDKTKAEQMLDIVNEVRASHNVAAVKLDKDASDMLAAYAEAYAVWNTKEGRESAELAQQKDQEKKQAELRIKGYEIDGKIVGRIYPTEFISDKPETVKRAIGQMSNMEESLWKGNMGNATYAAIATSDKGDGCTVIWLLELSAK